MSKLNQSINVVMFDDASPSNNPQQKVVDWSQKFNGIAIKNPNSQRLTLAPSEQRTIFSGQRTLTIDGTTTFSLSLSPLDSSIYRLTATSGAAPGFRTSRALALSGETLTVTIDNNAIANFELGGLSVPTFAGVVVGDTVYVPGTLTGDAASPLGGLNEGFWVVVAAATRKLSLKRPVGEAFQGAAGAFPLTTNLQVQAFSSGPVQVGDTLNITAGFSTVTRSNYTISSVTANTVEFSSTEPLPLETGILPGASGITIFSLAKAYLRIEADQPVVYRVNGDTSDLHDVQPRIPGDPGGIGWYDTWSSISQLVLVNKNSSSEANVVIFTAEAAS